MLRDLILKNRSYRRFDQSVPVDTATLEQLIDLARFSASGRNAQSIKYIISNEESKNQKVFSTLAWAGFLSDWPGPAEGERPPAYLIQVLDTEIAKQFFCDDGIAAQSILLGAVEAGLGGCIFRSINKPRLSALLEIPPRYSIINVIALGKPIEKVMLEAMKNDDYKYWRDNEGVHHVPKRALRDLILPL